MIGTENGSSLNVFEVRPMPKSSRLRSMLEEYIDKTAHEMAHNYTPQADLELVGVVM